MHMQTNAELTLSDRTGAAHAATDDAPEFAAFVLDELGIIPLVADAECLREEPDSW